jgi:hypothetical protein
MAGLGNAGNMQVIPPAALEAQLGKNATMNAQAEDAANRPAPGQDYSSLAGYVRGQYEIFRNHRNTVAGWSNRLLAALRTVNGQYDASVLQEIRKFGGSEIYARVSAQKCRAASSLLRDVYLGADRPWSLKPPDDPQVPQHIVDSIKQLLDLEVQTLAQQGKPPNDDELEDRRLQLMDGAREAATKRAEQQSDIAEDKIETYMREGGFYHALAEFLVDLPIFPIAIIKGPVVKVVPTISWPPGGGMPTSTPTPKLHWYRVAPFDIWFTPGVSDIENANIIEKQRITRAEINDMLDLPGYDVQAIRNVLEAYGRGGLYDNWDSTDAERAVLESRENPAWNRSGLISMMEFNGNCQGRLLQEYGLAVEDELRDYHVQVWMIGQYVIKAQLSPSPRTRHPYFITSFEKVPGTPVGNALIDILADLQSVANSTLRSLVNNMAMASGPQVVINKDRMDPTDNAEDMYPWKRWNAVSDPTSNSAQPPVSFFMPASNAQELMAVFKQFSEMADDVSAIPKYMQGGAGSGAGRTASGLAMLMGNASKLLQTVSANIDRDILEPALLQLFDLMLLTDSTGLLTGEEKVSVEGVQVAIQRETLRQRQIEFLQATMNPMDSKIVGMPGRAAVLRSVATTIGLPGERIVPNDETIEKMQKAQEAAAQSQPIEDAVKKGIQAGVTIGTQDVVKSIVEAQVPQQVQAAAQAALPQGIPQPGQPGQPPGNPVQQPGSAGTSGPPGAPPQSAEQMGAQGQGMQQPAPNMGPPQVNTVTNAAPKGVSPGPA